MADADPGAEHLTQHDGVARSPAERRESEAALLRAVFDASDGLLVLDAAGRVSMWNRRFAELWGAGPEVHDAATIAALARAQLEDGTAFLDAMRAPLDVRDTILRCRDGRFLERSARALPSGALWSFRDVTERVRTEEALRERQERYRELYDKTPAMMHSIDREGRLVSVSETWLRTLGYEREEVLGRSSVDFLTPASRRFALETVLPEYFRTGVCTDVPYRILRKDGEVLDVLLSAIAERDPDGSHRRSLAVLVDVTQRTRIEAERDRLLVRERSARESSESALALLDALFRTAPVGLAFLDRDLRYVRVNEMLARSILGVAPAQCVGRNIWEAMPGLAPTIAPMLLRVLETGQPITNVDITGEMPGASGETRSTLASYYPVRSREGDVFGVGVAVVDITEQKRAAVLQSRLYAQAQEAVRVRDDFLAIASHELRTPMTPLLIHLQLIERNLREGEPIELWVVERALRQVAKLTALVNDLLDSSRVRAGRLALQHAPVRLATIVKEAVLRARAASPRHTIELERVDDELIVLGDEPRLSQVVSNLIENAVKYSAPGSKVAVSLRRGDGVAVLSVVDHGIGIPPEQIPLLFDRFFRARNAPTSHYGGLGLGLAIARDIVERHGGTIEAESAVGVGSTFRVTLPLAS